MIHQPCPKVIRARADWRFWPLYDLPQDFSLFQAGNSFSSGTNWDCQAVVSVETTYLIEIFPSDVNSRPCRAARVGKTQSIMSIPRLAYSTISSGVPTPIR